MIKKNKNIRLRSKIKIRSKISGIKEKPRLTIYRSLNNIFAQLIDDSEGNTLVSASSLSKELAEEIKNTKGKISKSKMVGKLVAKKALEKNISQVVFDRNGYRYHGRVKAIADGAREGGLKF
ncbi:MAG: 50S ribosomal protein L18 [Ignavibacteria bacterium RIFOXYB2_FULL_35_12]|nr:MAG: 50S ribosomal protein L18 [Ignavibacteria bacterium GWA2_36_19]OGU51705.1 MAG: 50S ribosomal protein L18 [Ignavibacteria bacterium GWC2_35_8]OGU59929.1 MAG: 50S ribosomal protein L18 [Ignavibacteria bacterium GWF2_35_20]OGU80147.1 MAG: 50S ribosomal protein L18 [Ignavibacteria bacterium RIFOXYA2_FULL_35_9]OGU85017.1 MAG: 50S ribosomal protein L18 [Ignavibacteria bacterium RBG_16_35_7]OGU85367.1 MAG: 50S ribosomal protein L18 [Ignavibacteria bacterium RIFOXYA12_FULL_35_25]OGU89252.1 MA